MIRQILIAPAGWEERYELGVYKDCERLTPTTILIPYSSQYADLTLAYRERISEFAAVNKIEIITRELNYLKDISLYVEIHDMLLKNVGSTDTVLFNFTSTPRDILWNILNYLVSSKINTALSYYKPMNYDIESISCNAGKPKLIIKKSGISFPDRATCILALSGYDQERLSQLVNQFEPKKILIGRQIGEQLDNKQRNVTLSQPHVEEFEFNCYDTSNDSIEALSKKVEPFFDEYNVIATALGPKPCAITLFLLTQKYPQVGLVYIPAMDYSKRYSTGIDEDYFFYSKLEY